MSHVHSGNTITDLQEMLEKYSIRPSLTSPAQMRMLAALKAHRAYHDDVANRHGIERCGCVLCLNDDAAIAFALQPETKQ